MNKRAGYSLFEVLVAFTVMTMVLSVVLPRQAEFLAHANTRMERVKAADMAYSRLSELGMTLALESGENLEQIGDWLLFQRITSMDSVEPISDLVEVTVEIRSTAGDVLFQVSEVRVVR
ncbi:type II secretion system protein [Ruegeria sp. SCPT10]|uniref:type II secretion system protein n=1 Tax=Ruegeria sp. SCP10 TaxID=3141377 RepID=UPI0033366837